jgi:hypothetical protein
VINSNALREIAFAVALLFAHVAQAAPADDLEARGEDLAKQGRYSDAIDAFKAAERQEPRARHACLIALAYARRELWPQAELFLQQCHARGTANDPLPDWVAAEDAQIAERLAAANVALVTIKIVPDAADPTITVSSFQLDEQLTQKRAHLPFGHHVIAATSPGYDPAQAAIDITTREPQTVTIEMHVKPQPHRQERSRVPWIAIGAGAAVALAGVATDIWWAQPLRDDLRGDTVKATYTNDASRFSTAKWTTYGLWGIGAVGVVAGVVLRYRDVSVEPTPGGAMISMQWAR